MTRTCSLKAVMVANITGCISRAFGYILSFAGFSTLGALATTVEFLVNSRDAFASFHQFAFAIFQDSFESPVRRIGTNAGLGFQAANGSWEALLVPAGSSCWTARLANFSKPMCQGCHDGQHNKDRQKSVHVL